MPTIRIDPDVANNSLRVIAAAESDGDQASTVSSVSSARSACQNSATATTPQRRLNRAAIDAAKAVPASERARRLFEQIVIVGKRSEEHTSELKSLMRISYAVFCLKKK